MDKEKTIVFMDFNSIGQASIVKGALESNNIPCFLSNENSAILGNILSGDISGIRLNIFESDLEKAEEVMSLVNSVSEDDDYDPDESESES
jgi:hypothetical protein